MSEPRVLRVGTIDEGGTTLRDWIFDAGGEAPAFELGNGKCGILGCMCRVRVAGFRLDELRVLVAEGSPDEDPDA